jgi:RNase P/RNase MRP subunit p29
MSQPYSTYQLPGNVAVALRVSPDGLTAEEQELVGMRARVIRATEEFDRAIGALGEVIERIASNLRHEVTSADQVEITIHANFEGKANFKIFEAGGDAGIEVRLTWNNPGAE